MRNAFFIVTAALLIGNPHPAYVLAEMNGMQEFSLESVPGLQKTVDSYVEKIKVPDNIHADKMKPLAGETAKYYHSEEFQEKVRAETERIKKEVFGSSLEAYYKDKGKGGKDRPGRLSPSERIYIFVSSSMPRETLRTYVRDVSGLGDENIVFVMAGFIGGMRHIKPTIGFIAKALAKDKDCDLSKRKCAAYNVNFEIDPLLFRKYGVARVPAFVYVPQIEVEDRERSEGDPDNAKAADFHTLYGDASLEYVFETFSRETKKQAFTGLKEALKKGFY